MRRGFDSSFLIALSLRTHEHHDFVRHAFDKCLAAGDRMVLTPDVLAEFIHVACDPRRFAEPLTLRDALAAGRYWWEAEETEQLHPSPKSIALFFGWMTRHRLGRKRILDTMLAATLHGAGVTSLLTLNPDDFRIFACFELFPATP